MTHPIIHVEEKRPTLKKDAVPCIFDDLPERFQKVSRVRKPPKDRNQSELPPKKQKSEHENEEVLPTHKAGDAGGEPEYTEPENAVLQGPSTDVECNMWTDQIMKLNLPLQWGVHEMESSILLIRVAGPNKITHVITLSNDNVSVDIGGKPCKSVLENCNITEIDLAALVQKVSKVRLCEGFGAGRSSTNCSGSLLSNAVRCMHCKAASKAAAKVQKRRPNIKAKTAKTKYKMRSLKQRNYKLKEKVQFLKKEIDDLKKKVCAVGKTALEKLIQHLPKSQQEAIMACFMAAKVRGPTGRRYRVHWVYECLLMRTKDTALYEHIRENEILALPSRDTLRRYTGKLKATYGFQDSLFHVLKKKTADWSEENRHGILLCDEIKLTPGLKFNKATLTVEGFVDLGKYTSEAQETELGDHALVFMFQPLRGKWVQAVACFLTKSNVKADVLSKLILECTLLLENSGLRVDGVTMDGASWNRSVWNIYGVTEKNKVCKHPADDNRPLFLFSDFPHLAKTARNCMTKKWEIEVLEGVMKLSHWDALLMADECKPGNLRRCPNLSKTIVHPGPFDKMNTRHAWKFWSRSIAAGMWSYREEDDPNLQTVEPSVSFILRWDRILDCMNAKVPVQVIWLKEGFRGPEQPVSNREAMEYFLEYFKLCVSMARAKKKDVFSRETDIGIIITLGNTLKLGSYLADNHDFHYLLTARLNQDAIEQFFGMIRNSCGPNTTPEPTLFAQLFRLLSIYSLVKPPKGNNVGGVENLQNLLNFDDASGEKRSAEKKHLLDTLLDEILTHEETFEDISDAVVDHSYNTQSQREQVVSYLGGFTARRVSAMAGECQNCFTSLTKPITEANQNDRLTVLKSKGGLLLPSEGLFTLLASLEDAVLQCYGTEDVHCNTLFRILNYVKWDPEKKVGCVNHALECTERVIKFYLIMRLHFLTSDKTKEQETKKKKTRHLKKQAHLQ